MNQNKKNTILFILIIESLLFFLFKNDPFFGDGIITISRASVPIFQSNLMDVFYPMEYDAGHPTLIPWLLAFFWKLLGKSLWVSHLFFGLFSTLALWAFYKLSGIFLNNISRWFALVLICCSTFFISQTAMLNVFIVLLALWIWIWYFYFKKNFKMVSILMVFLVLTHLQGVFLLVVSFVFLLCQFLFKRLNLKTFIKQSLIFYLPASIFFLAWLFIHYKHTGWVLSSPNYDRSFAGLGFAFKSLLMSAWRILDYGTFILFIPLLFFLTKKKIIQFIKNPIYLISIVSILVVSVLYAFTTPYYIAHRYLLFSIPFIILGIVYFSEQRKNYAWNILALILLVSGNFWVYPGKTTGDITLGYRDIFPLYNKLENLKLTEPIYTYAPMWNSTEITHLEKSSLNFQPLYEKDIKEVTYVIKGNMSGDFTSYDDSILSTWEVITLEHQTAYINLYTNPTKVTNFPKGKKSQPRKDEDFMNEMKKILK